MRIQSVLIGMSLSMMLGSCGIFGIHFKVHNPKKEGKLPAFTEETILLGEMTPLRSCYDVKYYDLSVDFDPKQKMLSGSVDIIAEATVDFDSLQLDLHSNFDIISLKNLSSGKELKFKRRERAIFIPISKKENDKIELQVVYKGKPVQAKKPPWKGGFVWKKDKDKNPWFGVACESDGASIWWPLKDHTADEPDSMRLHYTVPADLVAVGNGQFEGITEEKDGKKAFHWFVSYPINTYNVTVYGGAFEQLSDSYKEENGDLALDYYVLSRNKSKAEKHFEQVKPIIKVYEELFGAYPWYRDGFKLIESPYAGMEHQTAIAYGNGYENDLNDTLDYIILHEVAHEWWGNSITARDMSDVWLQEGFATYAEALYLERAFGYREYMNHLLLYRWFIKNKYPVVGVEDRRWFHHKKGSDVYVKGAWILHSLRQQLGDDEVFFDIIKSFSQRHQYQIVESRDFVEIVNEKTGSDYSWFFQQYLDINFVPELDYAVNDEGELYYRWSHSHAGFNQLKVLVVMAGQQYVIEPSNEIQTLKMTSYQKGEEVHFGKLSLYALNEDKGLLKE